VPLHIERLSSRVTVQESDLSLSPAQIEKLVNLVICRLEERARESQRARAATRVTRQAAPPLEAGE
jgi:hypothetical protein